MTYSITKEIELDAGHRVPQHNSKCRNPHGHRYKVQAEVYASELVRLGSAEGMVLDFGDIKNILIEKVHDVLDHAFIVYEGDKELLWRLTSHHSELPDARDWKVVVFPYIPTAECIARWVYEEVERPIRASYNDTAYLDSITVWETPTSKATYRLAAVTGSSGKE